jgi:putative tryptophan/tyrosine transport system substrate-binding protein
MLDRKRREFITLLGSAAVAWPLTAIAQQPTRVHRVAHISPVSRVAEMAGSKRGRAFVQGLAAFGYTEGNNLVLEWRSVEGRYERLPGIIRELLSIDVDVIVIGTSSLTQIAKDATQTAPIVMVAATPVERGVVQSLARPGGNVTGLSIDVDLEIFAKRLELLKELLPGMSRVAFLWPGRQVQPAEPQTVEAAARGLGVKLLLAEFTGTEYADAFTQIARERPDAILVSHGAANIANQRLIAEFAARNRLPAMYSFREAVEDGGLIAYGVDLADVYRRAAGYVDRILKGAKPAELPVERPTKFELVINMKSARALGLDIPPMLLARANEVIE